MGRKSSQEAKKALVEDLVSQLQRGTANAAVHRDSMMQLTEHFLQTKTPRADYGESLIRKLIDAVQNSMRANPTREDLLQTACILLGFFCGEGESAHSGVDKVFLMDTILACMKNSSQSFVRAASGQVLELCGDNREMSYQTAKAVALCHGSTQEFRATLGNMRSGARCREQPS